VTTLKLAERGSRLSNGLSVREVRKRSETGRQTSLLSTHYRADYTALAASMLAQLVSGKLLQVHAATLQFGPLGRVWNGTRS
jgi:hypothetical protein